MTEAAAAGERGVGERAVVHATAAAAEGRAKAELR